MVPVFFFCDWNDERSFMGLHVFRILRVVSGSHEKTLGFSIVLSGKMVYNGRNNLGMVFNGKSI